MLVILVYVMFFLFKTCTACHTCFSDCYNSMSVDNFALIKPIIALYFESEPVLKFYNLETRCHKLTEMQIKVASFLSVSRLSLRLGYTINLLIKSNIIYLFIIKSFVLVLKIHCSVCLIQYLQFI